MTQERKRFTRAHQDHELLKWLKGHDWAQGNAEANATIAAAPLTERVPIPQNADQAAGMVLVGMAWLREHAPERLKAPQAEQQAVPEGFALVPVDPTDAMRIAGGIAHESSPAHDVIGPLVDAWAAMLAAAPAAPQAEPKGTATEGWRLVGASSPEEYAQFQTWLSYGKPHATPSPAVQAGKERAE